MTDIAIPEVGSTDWMDGIRTEEDSKNKNKLVALCIRCFEWHFFTGSPDRFLQLHDEECECGSKSFTELRSQRIWNEPWGRQVAQKLKNKRKK